MAVREDRSRVPFGTYGREASTAAMERGCANGSRPSGFARPKATPSSAPSLAP
ncbi:hypothetical protein [Streptomyces chryseus]